MLELKNIVKDYPAGGDKVHALKGIDLRFRSSEFVSVLGPSGCGKTTLLNIIGGLDRFTDGDLIINGRTTKDFRDRDWDAYRNHSVGFVFQSYNLIPHQTVLSNVELALTLSGVSKAERRERAIKALEEVGLGDQLKKRPAEMSGGQMQRVAIARALVNDPDIILADEPTGALDTETGVLVMEILKRISAKKLIIMVTHNPELAENYSTRVIRLLDGRLTDDSRPLTEEEYAAEQKHDAELIEQSRGRKQKMPSMSMFTAFSLSLRNLLTKKGRTVLTSFAGSIGIIGIALILSISTGVSSYIDEVQEESLASYPLSIESTVVDFSSLVETMAGKTDEHPEHGRDAVYTKPIFSDLVNAMSASNQKSNDLASFKSYIESERAKEGSDLNKALSAVKYVYDLNIGLYTKNSDGEIIHADPNSLMQDIMGESMGVDMSSMVEARDSYMAGMSGMFSTGVDLMSEMLAGTNGEAVNKLVKDGYEVVYGEWANDYDEIMLVLNENNELDDLSLYALGLKSHDEMKAIVDTAMKQENIEYDTSSWSYEEICGREYKMILPSDCYTKDTEGVYKDLRESDTGLTYLYDSGVTLRIAGIVRPSEDSDADMIRTTLAYTSKLTDYVISQLDGSEVVAAQLSDEETDIFTGLPFKTDDELTDTQKADEFGAYVKGLDDAGRAELFTSIMSIPTDEEINAAVEQVKGMTKDEMTAMFMQMIGGQVMMDEESIKGYLDQISPEDFDKMIGPAMKEQIAARKQQEISAQLSAMTGEQIKAGLDKLIEDADEATLAEWYETVMPHELSESNYDYNLKKLGYVNKDEPSRINLYTATFKNKDLITSAIDKYNEQADEEQKITYTDYIGIMLSSVTTIINAITYVLIAFVAISLIVSSIMIGVITLISVQERTKEIGILRAIGASKGDVSSMFNAETMIIGFTSGLLGVVVTYLLCIPINAVIHALTDITTLNAFLPVGAAAVLITISVLLTLISGLIPSGSAAKKDPVVALRTE